MRLKRLTVKFVVFLNVSNANLPILITLVKNGKTKMTLIKVLTN